MSPPGFDTAELPRVAPLEHRGGPGRFPSSVTGGTAMTSRGDVTTEPAPWAPAAAPDHTRNSALVSTGAGTGTVPRWNATTGAPPRSQLREERRRARRQRRLYALLGLSLLAGLLAATIVTLDMVR